MNKYCKYRRVLNFTGSRKDRIVTSSLPRRALNLIFEWLDLHRDELIENWERGERKGSIFHKDRRGQAFDF